MTTREKHEDTLEGLRMGLSAIVTYLGVLLPYADAEAQRRMQEAAQLLREIPGVRDELASNEARDSGSQKPR